MIQSRGFFMSSQGSSLKHAKTLCCTATVAAGMQFDRLAEDPRRLPLHVFRTCILDVDIVIRTIKVSV